MTRAVTLDARPATKRRTVSGRKIQRKRTVRRRDGFAVALQDAHYRKRVVRSAKAYSRKTKPSPEDETET
jgi:hypothetical protein